MAISQKKYVEIGSTVTVSAPSLPIRGLFIIPSGTTTGTSITATAPAVITDASGITGTSAADVAVKNAVEKYFAATGSTGLSPSDALIIKCASTGTTTPDAALQICINSGKPFSCCTVITGATEISTSEANSLIAKDTDNSIQFFLSTKVGADTSGKIGHDLSSAAQRLVNVTYGGTGNDYCNAACAAMGIICATDYDQPGSAPTLMYKKADGISASVTDDATYGTLTGIKVNFFGLTKTYGSSFTFYQRGVNCDGTDTAIEVNDLWLRGTISRGLMTLLTNMPKIPANATGVSSIYTVVDSAAQKGLDNGVILANKTLSAEKRVLVLNYAGGDEEAVNDVQSQGYHISCQLVETGNEYECKYVLIYSKGDAIKKIVGTHVLI